MLDLPNKLRVPVTIEGGWVTHPTLGYRDWHGLARCEEPIVGMSLMTMDKAMQWAKASEMSAQLEVRFLFSPPEGAQVQLSFGVARSNVRTWQVPKMPPEERPTIAPVHTRTGERVRLARFDGTPGVSLICLFLPGSAVKFGRNRLWHLRDEFVPALGNGPWVKMLTHGRAGERKDCGRGSCETNGGWTPSA